jgi:hypothetical protein
VYHRGVETQLAGLLDADLADAATRLDRLEDHYLSARAALDAAYREQRMRIEAEIRMIRSQLSYAA